MSDTLTLEIYHQFIELASTQELTQTAQILSDAFNETDDGSIESETIVFMCNMLMQEYDLRQIEPLWRKAKRFAKRNSSTIKQVGKVAACIGGGILLGASLDD